MDYVDDIERSQNFWVMIGLWFITAAIFGVFITLMGYGYLFIAHPASSDTWPMWVTFAIPLAVVGPDFPSVTTFLILWLGNIVAWALLMTVPVGFVSRRLGR